ncbi:acyl-CoA synthetase [Nocardiopsis sp. NRRL B-16309]|uniref:acyl-CoA synthetase n=1 Tax=Nocardiopsis sp. NRRL B-16309 TaxID=1519494 RepID=UPI0006AD8B44|nr:acyl-CoA synthetase [Nocardiopsis sp. NRRL B-16309]KOX09955.1 acyl-CoA synthetase [Nocardiopsis sp. NRRL B-16309]
MLLGTGADVGLAVRVGDEGLDRESLWAAASAVAERIAGAGAVAVHGEASLRTVVAVVGGLLAGVPVVPVPADSGFAERRHIVRDSGAALWLGEPREGVDLPVLPVDPAERSSFSLPEPPPEATALIMYTSGTTGPPKGVVLSRRAVAADLDALTDAWSWTPDDVLVHGLPLFHVHGLVLGLLGALRVGSPLLHTVRPTPAAYAAAARAINGPGDLGGIGGSGGSGRLDHLGGHTSSSSRTSPGSGGRGRRRSALFFGVPTVWSRIVRDGSAARDLAGARLLVSGSASLPDPVAEGLRAATGHTPVERYGMTESLITLAARADAPRRTGWVGTALTGVESRLRGEHGEPVPPDGESIGELQVRGATLFDGYLHLPEATAAAWTDDGWFRTGDAAVLDERGWHRVVGRMSVDMIKSGGYRIGAGEVEAVLLGHPAVREAAVVGETDDDLGQRIVAYLVGDGIDAAAVIDFVAARLSVHKRPREVRVVDALPRNAMGKVQKKLLGGAHH